jgi:hypothetical protein
LQGHQGRIDSSAELMQSETVSDAELKDLVASLAVAQKETEQRFKEAAQQSKDTDRRLNQLAGMFGNELGRLAEAIVEPACLRLFQERGIAVTQTTQRVESARAGAEMEIDVLLANGTEVVAVEVKSSLGVGDVNRFLEKLGLFRQAFPQFRNHVLYGAVAGLQSRPDVRRYAARKGLLVLKPSGSMMDIANAPNYRPKKF